jgi:hypothetical protein
MTRPLLLLLGTLVLSTQAQAQGVGPLVKYGKWALAAGAVGMNLLAARAHDRADHAFDVLTDYCNADPIRCLVNVEGRYADPTSELLYQQSLDQDRKARRWLFGGETALVGAAALFVWDLTRRTHKPDNIPFEPEVRSLRQATGVGLRISF